jgi:hypothetical protein
LRQASVQKSDEVFPLGATGALGALAKGYMEEDFKEVFQRYVAKSEAEALPAESRSPGAGSFHHAPGVSAQKPDRPIQEPNVGEPKTDESGGTPGAKTAVG